MRLSIYLFAFACIQSCPAAAQSTDCAQISLEVVRIGEDAIYLQTKHSGNACRWTGGDLDDLPADVGMNCFGQGVHHPVNTTEFCVEFPQQNGSIDCSDRPTKACTTVHAYSQSPSSAPSPYPSEAPSDSPAPSQRPSKTPSAQPSLSVYPSGTPTFPPSSEPSSLPSISSAPTFAPVFMVARGVEMSFPDVNVWLNEKSKAEFENRTLGYLSNRSDSKADGHLVQFQSVRVTDQFIHDDAPGSNSFHVVFDVAGFVRKDEEIELDFDTFVADFFSKQTVLDLLYDDILLESYVNGSNQTKRNNWTGPKVGMIASFVSISILIGGLVSFYARRNGVANICRRNNYPSLRSGSIDIEDHISPKPTASNDSESLGCNSRDDSETPHLGGYPIVRTYRSKQKLHGIGLPGRFRTSQAEHSRVIEGGDNITQRGIGTFQSSFLCADSNIEIPVTPLTNYDMSHISPRGVESDADEESVPSPANSDGVILARNDLTKSPEATIKVTQEGNRAKVFFKRGNARSQATKSDKSDAAVLLSSYGGISSSSGFNYP